MRNRFTTIVIGIMLLFAFIFLQTFTSSAEILRSDNTSRKYMALTSIASMMMNIGTALDMYQMDNKLYPISSDKILGKYMKDTKKTRAMLEMFDYKVSRDRKSYELSFSVYEFFQEKKMDAIPRGYPRYQSKVKKVEFQPGVFDLKNVKF